METLSNGTLTITVSEHGAELHSLQRNGHEYLWNGDPTIWARHSPVLFPIVGRVWENRYRVLDTEYTLPQHGLARDMDFKLESKTGTSVEYVLESNDDTLKSYPYHFRLHCGYQLEGDTVRVSWRVENTDARLMHFQIGAHPAFMLPGFDPADNGPRGYFDFDNTGELKFIHPVEKGCVSPEVFTLKRDSGEQLRIDANAFGPATYIFENGQLGRVSILDKQRRPYVSVRFDAPLVALWAPVDVHPECPFVCIEPWYGRCDYVDYEGDYASKPWMQHLAAGHTFEASYTIQCEQ